MSKEGVDSVRKNRLCNIRAPNEEWFRVWLDFQEVTKNLGLDNCFIVLSLCRAWLEAFRERVGFSEMGTAFQMVFVCQTNEFNYNVGKPRRERFLMDCSRILSKCTLCSRAFQAYIIEKARELDRSFSFKDFPEINHDLFRKLILELKKRRKILSLIPRTNPRFYILKEWEHKYPKMTTNSIVKPKFTVETDEQDAKRKGDFGKC